MPRASGGSLNSMPFDTHAAVKSLVAAGACEELAEAVVAVVAQDASDKLPSAADLARMSDTDVIDRIVKSGQPGNSALAEMQRRFSKASKLHGIWMLCLTVVILFFTAVQAYNAIGCRQFGEQPQIRENRERSDEQMRESSAGGSSSTSTATATTDDPDK